MDANLGSVEIFIIGGMCCFILISLATLAGVAFLVIKHVKNKN